MQRVVLFLTGEQAGPKAARDSARSRSRRRVRWSPESIRVRCSQSWSAMAPSACFRTAIWRISATSCRLTIDCRATSRRCSSVRARVRRLSYAMLAQAPADTFAGGISIGFSPELRLRKHAVRSANSRSARRTAAASSSRRRKIGAAWLALQRPSAPNCSRRDCTALHMRARDGEWSHCHPAQRHAVVAATQRVASNRTATFIARAAHATRRPAPDYRSSKSRRTAAAMRSPS